MAALTDSSAPTQITVLVVDDEPLIRSFLQRLLEKELKYNVLAAASGEEALSVSRQCAQRIDILVSDIDMRKMNGIQLYTNIAKERPETAVLFVSASAREFQDSYPDWTFLKKPFAPRDFVTKVQEVYSSQLQADRGQRPKSEHAQETSPQTRP